ncbi:hypothetical protein B0T17DRAFT_504983 [Bombardia bombarda]|uniref:Uncharacterized protein n=1 Tax=Bombardia bombarda TaxID=252184 RepID=A0AA40C8B1_9PEZI|nr:hypothetical protein B0T17DRAFT_504983 [Bombardia bombarda]
MADTTEVPADTTEVLTIKSMQFVMNRIQNFGQIPKLTFALDCSSTMSEAADPNKKDESRFDASKSLFKNLAKAPLNATIWISAKGNQDSRRDPTPVPVRSGIRSDAGLIAHLETLTCVGEPNISGGLRQILDIYTGELKQKPTIRGLGLVMATASYDAQIVNIIDIAVLLHGLPGYTVDEEVKDKEESIQQVEGGQESIEN